MFPNVSYDYTTNVAVVDFTVSSLEGTERQERFQFNPTSSDLFGEAFALMMGKYPELGGEIASLRVEFEGVPIYPWTYESRA